MKFTEQQLNDWAAYERVRHGGRFNMIVEAGRAMAASGLSRERYFFVINNFEPLMKAWGARNRKAGGE